MSQQDTEDRLPPPPHLADTTGDGYLDAMAAMLSLLFDDAEGDNAIDRTAARAQLLAFWGANRIKFLHRQGCISWGPDQISEGFMGG